MITVRETLLDTLSAEMRLILLATMPDGAETERLDVLCRSPLDWNRVFLLALWHKVAFLVLRRLLDGGHVDKALAEGNLPLLVLNHWKQLHAVNRHRNALLAERAAGIAAAAEQARLPLLIGKGGLALIGRVYRPDERKMYDLDYVAPRSQVEAVQAVMAASAFEMSELDHRTNELVPMPRAKIRRWLLLARGMPNFVRVEDDLFHSLSIVQVQFDIGSSELGKVRPAEAIMADPSLCGGIPVVSDAALFLQLCLHLVRESGERAFKVWNMDANLIKVIDLVLFAQFLAGKGRLGSALAFARDTGFAEECAVALRLVSTILHLPALPEEGIDRPEAVGQIAAQLEMAGRIDVRAERPAWEMIVGTKST